jgi:hypothetical protein
VTCPACGSAAVQVFHEQPSVPVNSCVLVPDRETAVHFPRGSIQLGWCTACGFISNLAFNPSLAEYSSRYEETQAYSPRFMTFARDLAERWVGKHGLAGGSVLEIGCGKGEFLTMMVEAGVKRGTGIDPGVAPDRIDPRVGDRVRWIADFYDERYRDISADAVVCRHTLEHIGPVAHFMRMIRANIGNQLDTVVLFELPDVGRVLDEAAFWDVYYEHCSYFTAESLARLFRTTGFEVLAIDRAFDDQYLLVEALPTSSAEPGTGTNDLVELDGRIRRFSDGYQRQVEYWRRNVLAVAARSNRSVIWGAGSKGVAFLTALGTEQIMYAVDVNPHKHGMYIAGTGQQIVPPPFLQEYRPDVVIAMNPIYREEIQRELDRLGVGAELVAL